MPSESLPSESLPSESHPLESAFLESLTGSEQKAQDFLEENSEVFPLEFYIGHHIDWDALVSKFRLSTSLTTDFMYVTRTSATMHVVLVELESPSKQIFTTSSSYLPTTAEFTAAQAQITTWKQYIESHRDEVIRKLANYVSPRWITMAKVHFKYVLVYGRDKEFRGRPDLEERFYSFNTDDTHYLTFDSVWRKFIRNDFAYKLHIMTERREKFTLKYLAERDFRVLAYLPPASFTLSEPHKKTLMDRGYDIEAWENGEFLSSGGGKQVFKLSGMKRIYDHE